MPVEMAMEYLQEYAAPVSAATSTVVGVDHFLGQNLVGMLPNTGVLGMVTFGAIGAAGVGTLYYEYLQ